MPKQSSAITDTFTTSLIIVTTRDAGIAKGAVGSKRVEANGNLQKIKKSLPIVFVSLQQQC